MSGLNVRIDKYLDNDGLAPRVPARISTIDPSGQSSASTSQLVPISNRATDFAHLELGPGTYYVEAVLPSGQTLTDSVTLGAGETRDVVLRAPYSPNEWFSWQHLMGNARPEPLSKVAPAAASAKTVRKAAPRPVAEAFGRGMGRGAAAAPAKSARRKAAKAGRKTAKAPSKKAKSRSRKTAKSSPPRNTRSAPRATTQDSAVSSAAFTKAAALPIGRPIKVLSTPRPELTVGDPQGAGVWPWLAQAHSVKADTFVKLLNQGNEAIDVKAYESNADRAVYRLAWQPTSDTRVQPLSVPVKNAPRYFAAVPRKRCVELISLPIPWHIIGSGREASIEIAIQQMHAADSFCASATARDENLGMLLGFLSSGSLSIARDLAETARDMLFFKVENPYAAAAGGYAMVSTALQASDRDWHGWIRNLMASFPAIPDGAIQWAQLCLRMKRSQSDIGEAKNALKLAYRRGLPFYSLGVKWLMEGLEWIAHDDPEAAQMLRNVRRVAWLTNFQQPFTILRIGGAGDV